MQTLLESDQSKMEALLHRIVQDEQQKLQQLGFIETYIPSPNSKARCNIFLSANWRICDRLLIVIASGNGIQPRIWSRSLVLEADITPDQYRSGSMYISNGLLFPLRLLTPFLTVGFRICTLPFLPGSV